MRILALLLTGVAGMGCAHNHLRWNTVKQSGTLTEIYEQQVLDNLAMFVHDPESLPFFSFPTAGAADITDLGTARGAMFWSRFAQGFASADVNLTAQRTARGSWTLQPIYDANRLTLMRCAYQKAVATCGIGEVPEHCPHCQQQFSLFYTGQPDRKPGGGEVTSDCLDTFCWFGYGCEHCVPKHDCVKVGHHCGVYVWVLPGGQSELSKLTLAILDFAFSNSAAARSKEVTWYFDDQGNPATFATAARVEKALIPFHLELKDHTKVVPKTMVPRIEPMDSIFDQNFGTVPQPNFMPGAGILQFDQSLRFLTPQPTP